MTDEGNEDERMIDVLQEDIETLTAKVDELKEELSAVIRERDCLYRVNKDLACQLVDDAHGRIENDEVSIGLIKAGYQIKKALVSMLIKPYENGYLVKLPRRPGGYYGGVANDHQDHWLFEKYSDASEALLLVVIQHIEDQESVERN